MNTKEFIQYANEHPELCEKMAACTTPEEVYAIASAEGLTDSLEVFKETMIRFREAAEISDKDLENVSAAGTTTLIIESAISAVSITAMAI